MQFIKCKNCETIIAIKDLNTVFTSELLRGATADNTITGADLCAACAAALEAERKAREAQEQTPQEEAGGENNGGE